MKVNKISHWRKALLLAVLLAVPSWAGPNASASISIDAQPADFGPSQVDATRILTGLSDFTVIVTTDNVQNLDTYVFRLIFDNTKFTYQSAIADDIVNGNGNILSSSGGTTCCFGANHTAGTGNTDTLEIYHTLTGQNDSEAPEGFGLLAAVSFTPLLAPGASESIQILDARFVDNNYQADNLSTLNNATINYQPIYSLQVNATSGGSILTPATSPVSVNHGAATAVEAQSDPGFSFVNWTSSDPGVSFGDPNAQSTNVILTSGNASVTANFTQITQTLATATTGSGTIALSPSGGTYSFGTNVTVTATPDPGWFFQSWQGSPVDGFIDSQVVVTMQADYSLTAHFVEGGEIEVAGIGPDADVYLYGTSGWLGEKKLDGAGTLSGINPGYVNVTIMEAGLRTEQYQVEVLEGAKATLNVDLRPAVPLTIGSPTLLTAGGADINTGESNFPAQGDFDRDGDNDLIAANASGDILYFEMDAGSYKLPVTLSISLVLGIRGLQVVDWNSDANLDLIVADGGGDITLFTGLPASGAPGFSSGTVIASHTGLTGFDLVDWNADHAPDFILGYDDGTVLLALANVPFNPSSPSWSIPQAIVDQAGDIDVGDRAVPMAMDYNGSGQPDLLIGNQNGEVLHYRWRASGVYQNRSVVPADGEAFALSGDAALARVYGPPGEFQNILTSSGNGEIFLSTSTLRGNFNTTPGSETMVNSADLQDFGDAWLSNESNPSWDPIFNLDLAPGTLSNQAVDVMDLAIFGDSWQKEK